MIRGERSVAGSEPASFVRETCYVPERQISLVAAKLIQSVSRPTIELTGKDFFQAIADVTCTINGGDVRGGIAATLGYRRDVHIAFSPGADTSSAQEASMVYSPDTTPETDNRSVRRVRFVRQPDGNITGYAFDDKTDTEKEVIPQDEREVLQHLANGLLYTLAKDAEENDKERNRRRS